MMKSPPMKGFLVRVMFQFEKISTNQLIVISQIINDLSLLRREFIEARFLRYASNFSETIEFLEDLNLIIIREQEIIPQTEYRKLLNELGDSQQTQKIIKSFFIHILFTSQASFFSYIYEFLSKFQLKKDHYDFLPTSSERLGYSGIRNFLIDLGLIYMDSSEKKYIVIDDYIHLLINLKKPQQLSPNQLLRVQKKKEEIGRAAELKVVEYEKQRLSGFPLLVKMVEHVAINDVMAGYDIRSFEDKYDKNGNYPPRFIEVKAVSVWDYKFYWSKNEIDKAMTYQQNYFLYLLPVIGKNEFDIKKLKIIDDPYSNVYKNEGEWIRTDELVAFSIYKD